MIWHKNHSGLDSNGNMWKNNQVVSMLKLAVACWREWHVEEKSMQKRKVRRRGKTSRRENEHWSRREKYAEGKSTENENHTLEM